MNPSRSSFIAFVLLMALLVQGPVQAAGMLCRMGQSPAAMMTHGEHDHAAMTAAGHGADIAAHDTSDTPDAGPDGDDCARPAPCCQGAALACSASPGLRPEPAAAHFAEVATRPPAALIARLDRPPIPVLR